MMLLTAAQIAAYAAKAGFVGQALVIAVAVALAESGGNAQAVSPTGDYGLWQIHLAAHPDVTMAQAFDPAQAAAIAYRLSGGGADWTPWATWTNGRAQQFMVRAQAAAAPAYSAPNTLPGLLLLAGLLALAGWALR